MANINTGITELDGQVETTPLGGRARSLGDDDIRDFKRAIRERLAIDHQFAADESGNTKIGTHKKLTLSQDYAGADPTAYDDVSYLYLKTVSGILELFWMDKNGVPVQLTTGGKLNDIFKSGDWIISTVTTARTGWTNVSATYSNKFMRINATPLTTGGADTHDHGAATGSHTLTSAEMPAHTHPIDESKRGGYIALNEFYTVSIGGGSPTTFNSQSVGGGGGHTHSVASADNIPAYVQVVVFQKN